MKVIIAEKPSVAREIARVVRATNKKNGYIEGGGYAVTWALGHLITAAMPEAYGIKGFRKENLPILPPVFTLIPRQIKEGKGYKADAVAVAQLKIIEKLFRACEGIIVATDAGREGELIFRFIYEYLGIAKPFDRLWISSLTDKAIREGLAHLQSGAAYDNLYYAARARSEADWLVGINATQAISIAAGRGTYSLGRVQTPTLCMVCSRFLENKKFEPQAFWQLSLAVKEGDETFRFSSADRWFDKAEATALYEKLKQASVATVETIVRKETRQEPPLLYDLTTLQKEANSRFGYSAEQTLSLAQKLYEKAYITYPRTGSRHIPEDVFAEIPALIAFLHDHPVWGVHACRLTELNVHSVDGKKVTDHHALLITGKKPIDMFGEEAVIYDMIAGRMLEAFSAPCVKDVSTVTAVCEEVKFILKGEIIKEEGWRAILKTARRKTRNSWKPKNGKVGRMEKASSSHNGRKVSNFRSVPVRWYKERPSPSPCTRKVRCWQRWRRQAKSWRTRNCVRSSKIAVSGRPLPVLPSLKPSLHASTWCAKKIARPYGERTCRLFHRQGDENRQCGDDRTVGSGLGENRTGRIKRAGLPQGHRKLCHTDYGRIALVQNPLPSKEKRHQLPQMRQRLTGLLSSMCQMFRCRLRANPFPQCGRQEPHRRTTDAVGGKRRDWHHQGLYLQNGQELRGFSPWTESSRRSSSSPSVKTGQIPKVNPRNLLILPLNDAVINNPVVFTADLVVALGGDVECLCIIYPLKSQI